MKTLVLVLVLAGFASAAQEAGHPPQSGAAHADAVVEKGEGHEPQNPNEIWWKWLNFAILVGGLGWLARKYGGPYFQERTDSIRGGIADATRIREEAEARAAEIERKVANLSVEVSGLRDQSKAEIAREGERVAAETATQIAKVQAQAQAEIASAAKHATQELRAYSAQLAVELASRQIRERITPQVQEDLADAFVTDLNNKTVVN